jgi:glycosyltransferase involved in cell wall biosynthesis
VTIQKTPLKPVESMPHPKPYPPPHLKIAQVISRLCVGGTSLAVILLTEALLKKNYPAALLAGEVSEHEASSEGLADCRGVHVIKIRNLSPKGSWWRDCKALLELVRWFRRERPLIVHTHTAKAGALGRIAARLAGVPICVHTFHGHVFHGHFSAAKSRVFLWMERWLARWTDCLIAVSPSQAQELVNKYRVAPAHKMVTIPVDFELDRYLSVETGPAAIRHSGMSPVHQHLIGWVGRLTPVKDPDLLLEAAALTLRGHPNASFAMVGDGELRSDLEIQLTQRRLERAIQLMGWRRDLFDFYSEIDVLVLTSKHEGTPLVLLEAMASWKPFVATNVGGVVDLMAGSPLAAEGLQIFDNGILTDCRAESVAAAIAYLLDRPDEAWAMGRAGRAFASKHFANGKAVEKLEDLYLRLLKHKRVPTNESEPTLKSVGEF